MSEGLPSQPQKPSPETLILTGRQYAEHPFVRESAHTYEYTLENGVKHLTYIGSEHDNHAENPLFTRIDAAFGQARPDLVFVEGSASINDPEVLRKRMENITSREEAIQRGESFYTQWLAYSHGVKVESPEPDAKEEISSLIRNGFSKQEILSYYVYRFIAQYQRRSENPTNEECREYLSPLLYGFKSESGWGVKEIEEITGDILSDLDVNDERRYEQEADPIPWPNKSYSRINEVAAASNSYRDQHIVSTIAERLKAYDHIFMVIGYTHAVMQEPALKAVMENIPLSRDSGT